MSKRVKKVVKLASEANLKQEANLYSDWLQDQYICPVTGLMFDTRILLPEVNYKD